MLRPTPGDPWGVEQYHWNIGAKENQQLNLGGPSNRQKSSGPNQLKQVAHRATIAHLSPMCQGQISFKQASMETSLSHYNSLEYFSHSRATNSAISVRIWPKLELVQDFMHVFVTCKFKEDQINSNRENVETSFF